MADVQNSYISIRLKFSRKGPVRYLGHLDMLRYFQKVMLRAEINIRYSEGYNPHQIMSFAYPLGVSMETEGDYMDIDVISHDGIDNLIDKLNSVMNEGIVIEAAKVLPENAKNAMSSVYAADYRVELSNIDEINLKDAVDCLMAKSEIMIKKEKCGKKSKGEIIEKNIKDGIFELKALSNNCIYMNLKSGSELNIKPVSVIEALSESIGETLKIEKITRVDIYEITEDEKVLPLIVVD